MSKVEDPLSTPVGAFVDDGFEELLREPWNRVPGVVTSVVANPDGSTASVTVSLPDFVRDVSPQFVAAVEAIIDEFQSQAFLESVAAPLKKYADSLMFMARVDVNEDPLVMFVLTFDVELDAPIEYVLEFIDDFVCAVTNCTDAGSCGWTYVYRAAYDYEL